MKSRKLIFLAISLMVVGTIPFALSLRNRQPARIFPAAIKRDCAPWDGSAFLVSIPYDAGSVITISIWHAPDLKQPATFSFPDDSMNNGNATHQLRFSDSVQLTGTVFFRRIEQGRPVEGWFDFHTEAGQRLRGNSRARWGNEIIFCG